MKGKRSRRPARAIEVLFATLLFVTPLAHGAVEPGAVAAVDLAAFVLALLWVRYNLASGGLVVRRSPVDLALLGLLGLAALSLAGSVNRHATRLELVRLLAYALLFELVYQAGRNRRRLLRLGWAIAVVGAVLGAAAMALRGAEEIGLKTFTAGAYRLAFTFANHSHFAAYEAAAAMVALGIGLGRGGSARPLALLLAGVAGLAVFFSLSRGGLLALTAGAVFLAFALARVAGGRRRALALLGFAATVALLAMALAGSAVRARLATLASPVDAGRYRIEIWKGTMAMIRERPWRGFGLGSYPYAHPRFQTDPVGRFHINHAHCEYLELAAEIGLPGLGVGLAGLAALLAGGLGRRQRPPDREIGLLGLGALAACVTLAAHWAIDFDGRVPSNALLFVTCAGLALAAAAAGRETPPEPWLRIAIDRRARAQRASLGVTAVLAAAVVLPWLGGRWLDRARELQRAGEREAAATALGRARWLDPGNPEVAAAGGDLARARAQATKDREARAALLRQALAAYDDALAACPVCGPFLAGKAGAARALGDPALERASLIRAVALAPASPAAHLDLGNHYLRRDQIGAAKAEFRRYLELDREALPDILQGLWYRVAEARDVAEVVPPVAALRQQLADFFLEHDQSDLAVAELRAAFDLEPGLERCLDLLRGLAAARAHDPVIETAGACRERFGADPRLARFVAIAAAAQGDVATAGALLQRLLAEDPSDPSAYLQLAGLHRQARDPAGAVAVLRQGCERLPGDARLHFQLGLSLRQLDRPEEALAALREAVDRSPRSAEYRYQLGVELRRLGLPQEAHDEWRACLEVVPDEPRCVAALRLLRAELGIDPEAAPGDGGDR